MLSVIIHMRNKEKSGKWEKRKKGKCCANEMFPLFPLFHFSFSHILRNQTLNWVNKWSATPYAYLNSYY